MLLLSEKEIRSVFSMRDAMEAVKEAFALSVRGGCQAPLRTNIQAAGVDGCFLFMPAYAPELETAALKNINIFPGNIERGLPTSTAQVLLMDGNTGVVTAVLDGTCVTQLRTGAASGAAFDLLARQDAKEGALIGTGGQAAAQLEAMLCARPLRQVRVYDMNQERARRFAAERQEALKGYGAEILAAASSEEAVEGADLIATVTPSSTPVFDGARVKPGAVVSCVGSYQPHMQEMDPVILERAAKIYFDSQEAVLAESGDIQIPLAEGRITQDRFTGELGQVVLGNLPGREGEDEIIVFKTVGIAAQDLVTAKRIYDRAVQAGIGLSWGDLG